MPGDEHGRAYFLRKPQDLRQCRAEALGCLRKPRDGYGDQIGYLRLRVAPTGRDVNPTKRSYLMKDVPWRLPADTSVALRDRMQALCFECVMEIP
jgi:hypothetical protein